MNSRISSDNQKNVINQPLIEVSDLCFGYGSSTILEDVSFRIKEGDRAVILGPNGGGKTTLLKLILGLMQPDSGTIKIRGRLPGEEASSLGYVPQYALFDSSFPITVEEVVLSGRIGKTGFFYSSFDRKKVKEALGIVGLDGFAKRSFSALSGGQRQRVLIARALAGDPSILILDEPTANVDPGVGEKLYDLLNELSSSMTLLLVTHDLGFVSNLINRVFCVNRKVREHPSDHLDTDFFSGMYGSAVQVVRHDIELEESDD